MAVLGEDLLMADGAVGQPPEPALQLAAVQQAGVVLEQAHDLSLAILEGQAVEVAHVDDHGVGVRGDPRVALGAEHRGGRGIHHQKLCIDILGRIDHGL